MQEERTGIQMNDEIEQFVKERDEALMSLDETRIKAMFRKFNPEVKLPDDALVFWIAVHKAITGATGLPKEFRQKSKQWLTDKGYQSMDDGEL